MAEFIKRGENKWLVRVFRGRDASGKRLFENKTVKGTKKEALAWARDKELAISTGTYREPSRQTLREFLEAWLDGAASQRVRPQTLDSYRKLVRNYILPAIGERKLTALPLPEIDRLYASMRERRLSPRTIRYTHSVLRSAMTHAVRSRLIPFNPTDHATLPRQERKEMKALAPDAARRFLAAASEDRWAALWVLLVRTGLRPGEALGLKWSDIQGPALTVQRVLVVSADGWRLDEPKTRRSRRTLPLDPSTVRALHAHRRQQAEEKLRAGPAYADRGFIFASSSGAPLDPKNLAARHFKKILGCAGLPPIRLYDLRHTQATLMLAAGVNPKVASERLGHSSITLTMDTYSHVLPDMQQDAVERVDRLLAQR